MFCIYFYTNHKKEKIAQLQCDSYDNSDDTVLIATSTFDYPCFVKRIEWVIRKDFVTKITMLRKENSHV